MTSATERLRALLDERGVEWEGREDIHTDFTFWCGVHACETGPKPSLAVYHLTPEQAIAATLGDADATDARQGDAGTCHDIGGCRWFRCSACGFGIEDMYVSDEDGYPPEDQPRHCPNCGRKVVNG